MIGIIIALLSALLLCALILYSDAGTRRVNRRLAALGDDGTVATDAPTLTQAYQKRGQFDELLRIVFGYRRESPTGGLLYVILIGSVGGVAVVVIASLMFPVWLAIIEGFVTGCLLVRTVIRWQQDRYADKLLRQLPDTIELTVSAVRAGLPVAEAFRGVAREMPSPTHEQFTAVMNEIALGRPIEEALRGVFDRSRVMEYAMFAVTLAVQMRSGGRLAETLQILGDAIRERVALAGKAKALAGEAKIAMRVMGSLPLLCGGAMWLENPSSIEGLFDDQRGRMLLSVALTMITIGILSMRRMIKKGTTV